MSAPKIRMNYPGRWPCRLRTIRTSNHETNEHGLKTVAASGSGLRPEVVSPELYLFDHLVRNGQHVGRDGEAESAGGLQVDGKIELGGLNDRQIGRLGTVEDSPCIVTNLTIRARNVGAVAHQAAGLNVGTVVIGHRNRMRRRECRKLNVPAVEEAIGRDEQRLDVLLSQRREGRFDLAARACLEHL